MKTTKILRFSNCCDGDVIFCPPGFREKGYYYCNECSTECETYIKEIKTHKKIGRGHYRPNKNK